MFSLKKLSIFLFVSSTQKLDGTHGVISNCLAIIMLVVLQNPKHRRHTNEVDINVYDLQPSNHIHSNHFHSEDRTDL